MNPFEGFQSKKTPWSRHISFKTQDLETHGLFSGTYPFMTTIHPILRAVVKQSVSVAKPNSVYTRSGFCFSREPAVVNMDPNQSAMMARIAMRHGNYPEALHHLSMALRHIPPHLTQFGAPLLADRAECFWQLGHAEQAVQDIMDAISIGLPGDAVNSEVKFKCY